MNKKTFASIVASTFVATLAVTGIAFAASPVSNDTSLLNKGTVEIDSLKVGKQGAGGVTFFNGTIVNATTNGGEDNPVTLGDNVRIDGKIYRGDTAGPSGGIGPVKIDDDVDVTGDTALTNVNASGYLTVAGSTSVNTLNTTGNLDVSGTTTVDNVTVSGDVAQSLTKNGVVKAWAHVNSAGTLLKGYNVTSSSKQATGTYNVTLNFDPAERVFAVTPSGSSDDTVAIRFGGAVNSATDNTVRVRMFEDAGTLADSVFMLVVH